MAIDTGGRPLSPHLQVYRPQLNSFMSILHRATGVFLAIGGVGLAYWLYAVASGGETYECAQALFGSIIGKLALIAWSYALFYHLCNGIRHLVWDTGRGLDMESVYRGGYVVLVASVILTAAAWLLALV